MFSYLPLLSLVTGVFASSISRRQEGEPTICTNFTTEPYDWNNSNGLGFADGIVEDGSFLTKTSTPKALFKFGLVLTKPASFYIQPWGHSDLAFGLADNSSLILTENRGIENTKFIIECYSCGGGINDNCFMRLFDNPEYCVRVGQVGGSGSPVYIEADCERKDLRRFNYFIQQRPQDSSVHGHQVAAALGNTESTLDVVNLSQDYQQLMTNSYVGIALLAGILVAMIALAVITVRSSKKGSQSPTGRLRHDSPSNDTESFVSGPNGKYSD